MQKANSVCVLGKKLLPYTFLAAFPHISVKAKSLFSRVSYKLKITINSQVTAHCHVSLFLLRLHSFLGRFLLRESDNRYNRYKQSQCE